MITLMLQNLKLLFYFNRNYNLQNQVVPTKNVVEKIVFIFIFFNAYDLLS